MGKKKAKDSKQAANLGFEANFCLAAEKLRNNMDAAEYEHAVLGLIFRNVGEHCRLRRDAPSRWLVAGVDSSGSQPR